MLRKNTSGHRRLYPGKIPVLPIEKEDSAAPPMAGRWWEAYLVRYLTGCVVGAGMVLLLSAVLKSEGQIPKREHFRGVAAYLGYPGFSSSGPLIALALVGVGYCYLVSTPVTVFHAGRMKRSPLQFCTKTFWFFIFWACIFLLFFGSRLSSESLLVYSWLAIIPGAWIVANQWWVIMELSQEWPFNKRREVDFVDFYMTLAKARARQQTNEVRESYSHLREHANSVFIVILEVFFGLAISSIYIISKSLIPCIAFTLLWLVPNVFLWGQANLIEDRLRSDSLDHN